jgi:hypothetical protein
MLPPPFALEVNMPRDASSPSGLAFLALSLLVLWASAVQAQDSPEDDPAERLRALESWIVLEEETAPDAPLLRFDLGFVGVIETRSQIRADRGNVPGTRLDDLEQNQGMSPSGIGPWVELSLGSKIRGGVDAMEFSRRGRRFEQQDDAVDFNGVRMAEPGDYLRAHSSFLTLSGFVEWDLLFGRTYRIGFVGGMRYFRLDFELESIRFGAGRPTTRTERVRGELISPVFGGLVELTPFPYLSVYTHAQFMNWSWERLGLEEARFFQLRLGARLNVIPDVLGIGFEYRFLSLRAEPSARSTGGRRVEGAIVANGLSVVISVTF